jgi:hypothetical protein
MQFDSACHLALKALHKMEDLFPTYDGRSRHLRVHLTPIFTDWNKYDHETAKESHQGCHERDLSAFERSFIDF